MAQATQRAISPPIVAPTLAVEFERESWAAVEVCVWPVRRAALLDENLVIGLEDIWLLVLEEAGVIAEDDDERVVVETGSGGSDLLTVKEKDGFVICDVISPSAAVQPRPNLNQFNSLSVFRFFHTHETPIYHRSAVCLQRLVCPLPFD